MTRDVAVVFVAGVAGVACSCYWRNVLSQTYLSRYARYGTRVGTLSRKVTGDSAILSEPPTSFVELN